MKAKIVVTHPATGKEWQSEIKHYDDIEVAYKNAADVASGFSESAFFTCANRRHFFPKDFLAQCVITVVTEPKQDDVRQ